MDVGDALCGALANLALHDDFRGSFAQPISSRPSDAAGRKVTDHQSPAADTKATTTARALVEMAGDKKVKRCLKHIEIMFCSIATCHSSEARFRASQVSASVGNIELWFVIDSQRKPGPYSA